MLSHREKVQRRAARVRSNIRRNANGRPRLSVFRSSKHIYAQIIGADGGSVLASASTLAKCRRVSWESADSTMP